MHFLGLLRRSRAARADRPDRFVRDDRPGQRLHPGHGQDGVELAGYDARGLVALALFEGFTHAEHRHQRLALGRHEFPRDQRVALAEQLATLRVADQHVAAADVLQHRGGHLAREGALRLRADRLGAERHAGILQQATGFHQVRERRAKQDFRTLARLQQIEQTTDETRVFRARPVHFPVARDERLTHG